MRSTLQTGQASLSRDEARFLAQLRDWDGCDDALRFTWQVLSSQPAITGPEPQLWLVPSATRLGQFYLVDLAARACTCDGFHYRHHCPHLRVADRAARLRLELCAGDANK